MTDAPHYPNLFSPVTIGPLVLRNRLLMSAMTTGFGFVDGAPDERAIAYFAERTRGVALAVVAFGAVAPEGRVEQMIPWMWREDAEQVLRPLAAAIRAAGALPCLQLGHGGRQVSPRVIGEAPVGPSPLAIAVHNTEIPPRALEIDEIQEIVRAFGRAARKAADAGFAAVEVHGAHGYLIQQFLSPQSNERTDEYGGATVTERARFGCEVIAEVRRAAPELAVIVRINGSDVVPGGLTPSDSAEAARAFVGAGAQAFVVSAGVYGSVPYTIPLLDDPEATFLDSAAFIRQSVGVPVIAVGRFTLPAVAEGAIAGGQCDAVALGRGLLADPDWVAKAAAGHAADIRPCIATVQGCAGMLQHGGEISCAVNPSVGRESLPVVVGGRPSAVVVIGGGPAGLESARRAAELGHRVVLHEALDRLGGAMALAAQTPVLAHLRRLITWYERQLRTLGVDVRLGSRASAADGVAADLVVVAVGSSTAVPLIDGYDSLPAWTLEDLMSGEPSTLGARPAPSRPVVIGGGSRALAAALWLALGGAEPTILSNGRLGADNSGLTRRALVTRLHNRGVPMLIGRPTALVPTGVQWVSADGRPGELDADGAVICEPVQPNRFEVGGLARVAQVGDARRVGDIPAAITDGRDAIDAFTREGALNPTG